MSFNVKSWTVSGMAASLVLLSGCFTGNDDGAGNKDAANTAVTSGTGNLETSLTNLSDFEEFEYGKEDLTSLRTSNADFERAVQLDPTNSKARLGSAVTGVLLAAQSEGLSDVVNQSLDSKSPLDSRLAENAPLARAAVLRKVAQAATFPEFHVIQQAIADTLLPALESAIADLRVVHADPAFSLTLTIDGQARELDHAEASVLLAGFLATHGLVTLWLSYDIDLDHNGSYDYLDEIAGVGDIEDFSALTPAQQDAFNQLAEILKPGSPFLAVHPAWKARLAGVDDELEEAMVILREGMNSIRSETDPQLDDVLKLCGLDVDAECIGEQELDDGLAILDSGIKYIQQPYVLDIPDLDTAILIDFSAYFNVQDYKKLLPWYGFYNAAEWSDEKPVFYFTDAGGNVTGNLKTLADLAERQDLEGLTDREVIAELRTIIHFQDPTFQGFLPGATEAGLWDLILKAAEQDDAVPVAKRTAELMDPRFSLSLLGRH